MAQLSTTEREVFALKDRPACIRLAGTEYVALRNVLEAAVKNPETHPFDLGIIKRILARELYCLDCGQEHRGACNA